MGHYRILWIFSTVVCSVALGEEVKGGHAWSVTHSNQEAKPALVLYSRNSEPFLKFPLPTQGVKREAASPQVNRRQDNSLDFQFIPQQTPNFGFPFGGFDPRQQQFDQPRQSGSVQGQVVVQPGQQVRLVVPGQNVQKVPEVLTELQRGMAEKVFLASSGSSLPQGFSTLDIPYIASPINGQPPAVFVAPASLPLPKGYTRVSIPVQGITFLKSVTTETPLKSGEVSLATPVQSIEQAVRQESQSNRPFDNTIFEDTFQGLTPAFIPQTGPASQPPQPAFDKDIFQGLAPAFVPQTGPVSQPPQPAFDQTRTQAEPKPAIVQPPRFAEDPQRVQQGEGSFRPAFEQRPFFPEQRPFFPEPEKQRDQQPERPLFQGAQQWPSSQAVQPIFREETERPELNKPERPQFNWPRPSFEQTQPPFDNQGPNVDFRQPTQSPQRPFVFPQQPFEIPQQPSEIPQQPFEIPQQPFEIPQQPSENPQQLFEIPQQPAQFDWGQTELSSDSEAEVGVQDSDEPSKPLSNPSPFNVSPPSQDEPEQAPDSDFTPLVSEVEQDESENGGPSTVIQDEVFDYDVRPEVDPNEGSVEEEDEPNLKEVNINFGQKINSQQNPHMLHNLPEEEVVQQAVEEDESDEDVNPQNVQNSPMIFSKFNEFDQPRQPLPGNPDIYPNQSFASSEDGEAKAKDIVVTKSEVPATAPVVSTTTTATTTQPPSTTEEAKPVTSTAAAPPSTEAAPVVTETETRKPVIRKKIVKKIRSTTTTTVPTTTTTLLTTTTPAAATTEATTVKAAEPTRKVIRKLIRRPTSTTTPAAVENPTSTLTLADADIHPDTLKEIKSEDLLTTIDSIPVNTERSVEETVATTEDSTTRSTRPIFRRTKPTKTTTEVPVTVEQTTSEATTKPERPTRPTGSSLYRRTKPTAKPVDQQPEQSVVAFGAKEERPKEQLLTVSTDKPVSEKKKIKIAVRKRPLTSPPDAFTTSSSLVTEEPSLLDTVHQMMQAKKEKEANAAADVVPSASNQAEELHAESSNNEVIGVSTATEVSLMYELCYRGRCVKVNQ